jgi:hypothetical protein
MEVHPEDRYYGEEKTFFPVELKDIKEDQHKKIGEHVRADQVIAWNKKKNIEAEHGGY